MMKAFILFVCIVTTLFTFSCSPKLNSGAYEDGEVRFNEKAEIEKGIIHVMAIGVGRNQDEAKAKAKANAVRAVLFKGVAKSNVQRPLVSLDIQDRKKAYFDKFFAVEGEYLRYIVETAMAPEERRKVPGGYRVGVFVKIYYSQLQSKLEHDEIIQKFGL